MLALQKDNMGNPCGDYIQKLAAGCVQKVNSRYIGNIFTKK